MDYLYLNREPKNHNNGLRTLKLYLQLVTELSYVSEQIKLHPDDPDVYVIRRFIGRLKL